MLRDALEQIQTNYGERIIIPPVFIASESLGKYLAVAFMSENENGKDIDVVICNSSISEVLGCMTIHCSTVMMDGRTLRCTMSLIQAAI